VDLVRFKQIEKRQGTIFTAEDAARLTTARTGPTQDKELICPRCASVMKKGRYAGTDVVIDFCKHCTGMWLDDQELEKLQVLAESKEATGGRAASGGDTPAPEYRRLASTIRDAQAHVPSGRRASADARTEEADSGDEVVPEAVAWSVLIGLFVAMLVFVVLPISPWAKAILAYWLLALATAVVSLGTRPGQKVTEEIATDGLKAYSNSQSPLGATSLVVLGCGALFAIIEFELWWHDREVSFSVTQVWLLTLLVLSVVWLLAWAYGRQTKSLSSAKEAIATGVRSLILWACGYPLVWLVIGFLWIIEEGE